MVEPVLKVLCSLVFFEVDVLMKKKRVSAIEELEEKYAEGVEIAFYGEFTATRVYLGAGVWNCEAWFEFFHLRVIGFPEV